MTPWDDEEFPGKWLAPTSAGIGGYDAWKTRAPAHETEDTCQKCGGYGEIETGPDSRVTCDGECGGVAERGKRRCWPCSGKGTIRKQLEKVAAGVYVTVDSDCPKCHGSGRS